MVWPSKATLGRAKEKQARIHRIMMEKIGREEKGEKGEPAVLEVGKKRGRKVEKEEEEREDGGVLFECECHY